MENKVTTYKFNSQIQLGNVLTKSFTQDEVKNEPMLFSCDFKTSVELGGPLTHAFLGSLSQEFFEAPELIVDSRVHMLMSTNFFPAILGWHTDDVPRNKTNGQPNYDNPEYHSKHAMCLVNGDVCPTEFALGECELPKIDDDKIIYKEWHPIIDDLVKTNNLKSWFAPTDQIIYFDWQTIHQASETKIPGWRWFIRASINTNRKPVNELRKQVQVYLKYPYQGW